MPIYEFYCLHCNTIFNFFSKKVNVSKRPACPSCGRKLQRQVSLFSCIGRAQEDSGMDDLPFDESKVEQAVTRLAAEAENLNEEDPRQAAALMRKFTDMTGVQLGNGMQEALQRLESGEDPEKIESEMGDVLEHEDPFLPGGKKHRRQKAAPKYDETLYEL